MFWCLCFIWLIKETSHHSPDCSGLPGGGLDKLNTWCKPRPQRIRWIQTHLESNMYLKESLHKNQIIYSKVSRFVRPWKAEAGEPGESWWHHRLTGSRRRGQVRGQIHAHDDQKNNETICSFKLSRYSTSFTSETRLSAHIQYKQSH